MRESGLWRYVSAGMRGRWDASRHEGTTGVPDVSFGLAGFNGWIELKKVARWPARGGILKVPHFTDMQRAWIRRRMATGGNVWLLLQVGEAQSTREFLLLEGHVAAAYLGSLARKDLLVASRERWEGRIEWARFRGVLATGGIPKFDPRRDLACIGQSSGDINTRSVLVRAKKSDVPQTVADWSRSRAKRRR